MPAGSAAAVWCGGVGGGLFRRGCGAPGSTKIGRPNPDHPPAPTTTDAYPPCRMTARVTRCSLTSALCPSRTAASLFFPACQAMQAPLAATPPISAPGPDAGCAPV
ncbi:hypothetical protein J3E74DRAFT_294848 [Bipolaris maydis]|nr:hypothetical protein J3E74DRAFT_294848 [Bipolaris maydis]